MRDASWSGRRLKVADASICDEAQHSLRCWPGLHRRRVGPLIATPWVLLTSTAKQVPATDGQRACVLSQSLV
jgi:hypothetical protein